MHVRGSAWEHLFNVPPPKGDIGFTPVGVFEALQNKVQ
jgi:hypothetical protein